MKGKLLVAMFGGAILGAALSSRIPHITVIVNAGNQGSIDIKVDNTISEPQSAHRQVAHPEHAPEVSAETSQPEAKSPSDSDYDHRRD